MREKPILFSAPMVRAILDGSKTQTRRVVKRDAAGRVSYRGRGWHLDDPQAISACPYGQPGDRLWVRETWGVLFNDFVADVDDEPTWYRATDDEPGQAVPYRWRPSIHMPRARSRITLEITGVRVDRLQSISGADAVAEGVRSRLPDNGVAQSEFADLWRSINGAESWSANPWVWVVEFTRCA